MIGNLKEFHPAVIEDDWPVHRSRIAKAKIGLEVKIHQRLCYRVVPNVKRNDVNLGDLLELFQVITDALHRLVVVNRRADRHGEAFRQIVPQQVELRVYPRVRTSWFAEGVDFVDEMAEIVFTTAHYLQAG